MNRRWADKDVIRVLNLAGFSEFDVNDQLMELADECLSRYNIYTEAANHLRTMLDAEALFH